VERRKYFDYFMYTNSLTTMEREKSGMPEQRSSCMYERILIC